MEEPRGAGALCSPLDTPAFLLTFATWLYPHWCVSHLGLPQRFQGYRFSVPASRRVLIGFLQSELEMASKTNTQPHSLPTLQLPLSASPLGALSRPKEGRQISIQLVRVKINGPLFPAGEVPCSTCELMASESHFAIVSCANRESSWEERWRAGWGWGVPGCWLQCHMASDSVLERCAVHPQR